MHVRDFSNCGVPCFNLGTDDGRFLTTVLERTRADGRRRRSAGRRCALDTEMLDGLKGHDTIGTIRGRNDSEIIIVNAHADGWFDAAGDNGDGLAVLIASPAISRSRPTRPGRTLSASRVAAITVAA